ncbi:hypothetical protein AABB24_038893, partial [Solanum stoloniferum]
IFLVRVILFSKEIRLSVSKFQHFGLCENSIARMISILTQERLLGAALGAGMASVVVFEQRKSIYKSISENQSRFSPQSQADNSVHSKEGVQHRVCTPMEQSCGSGVWASHQGPWITRMVKVLCDCTAYLEYVSFIV